MPAAVDYVGATAAGDQVVAGETKDRVVARAGLDRVGTVAVSPDGIIPRQHIESVTLVRKQSNTLIAERQRVGGPLRGGDHLEIELAANRRWKVGPIRCGDDVDRLSRREERVLPTWYRCHVPFSSSAGAVCWPRP